LLFDAVYQLLRSQVRRFDVLFALGTHPPMNERQMCRLLGIDEVERHRLFAEVGLFNHEWDVPERLLTLGRLSESDTAEISQGLLVEDVPVTINSRIADYDVLLVLGPVFPHEVVGFSGGNKYFFPGIAGAEVLNFFHWLGALITNARIIGVKDTPVRRIVDRAAALIPVERRCLAFVVSPQAQLHGLFYGAPETAWSRAADLSARVHIARVPAPFRQVLSCAPPMYDELWVAGKCMYKLEPVVADGGELIIYAPHLHHVSITHGGLIDQIGYHCRDYFMLVDLVFRQAGWRRRSMLGESMKYVDLELVEPITGEAYQVQVKSKAGVSEFEEYAKAFSAQGFRKLYFVVHSPSAQLEVLVHDFEDVELVLPSRLGGLVVDGGLVNWVLDKVR
jgi:nickel-dependent lactate racemase